MQSWYNVVNFVWFVKNPNVLFGVSVVVAIAPLHLIPYNPVTAMKKLQLQSHDVNTS